MTLMKYLFRFSILLILFVVFLSQDKNQLLCSSKFQNDYLSPSVVIAIFVRNKEHTLPYFFGYLERLDYPVDRISLWIRSDHNVDESANLIETWLKDHRDTYHSVDFKHEDSPQTFTDGPGVFEWSPSRFSHLIKLKETAFEAAKNMWADYILFLDCDAFLVNNQTLKHLIQEQKTVIAPVMETLGAYSNFWCGMTEQGYYKRTDEYLPILERDKIGCFEVPMIHSVVLVDLRRKASQNLTFDPKKLPDYSGPVDDMLVFAQSAKASGIKMFVLNKEEFGYMMAPLEKDNSMGDDKAQLVNLKVEMMVEHSEVFFSPSLEHFLPMQKFDRLGFDQVYLINLDRRPSRRVRMVNTLNELGVEVHLLPAVDGQLLNDTYIDKMGIKMLPEYADPYHKRPLTRGEIGCFLSHYFLWEDIIAKQHRTALVLEDDLRFEPHFRNKISGLLKDIQKIGLLWDLIYLGRKRLSEDGEPFVQGTTSLVHVDYSYWTLCYLITIEGAKKLVSSNPLSKMVPVDEFLPIMFDRHPEDVWKNYYSPRNLRAFSVQPLLVFPTHYTGEENYISDTEDSDIALPVTKDEL